MTRIVGQVRDELSVELRERVRARLHDQPVDWLVEQLLTLVLPEERRAIPTSRWRSSPVRAVEEIGENRAARMARLRELDLDEDSLPCFMERYRCLNRSVLEAGGYLVDPPLNGTGLISAECRSPQGEALLCEVKDVLYGLLFGGEEEGVLLGRVKRELLTLTVPRAKAHTLAFLFRAATEVGAEGTWCDPRPAATDDRAPNTIFQIEYGEVAGELVGGTLSMALKLINDLEINERVLHGRTESIEESTLIDG
ncbi:hypothetical protein [Streptosporangium sp. NPDC051022]|uniref:hypothetical protein n=1 Tax=Streptosporangium sp. NPDC051022 TaxID=3155752 RepID=UPI00344A2498